MESTTINLFDYMTLASEACDPMIEDCSIDIHSAGIRPPMASLVTLVFGFFAQSVAPLVAIAITAFGLGYDDFNDELELLILPALLSFFTYMLPFLLTNLYFITGSDWILVYWLDDVLVALIEHYVSNINPILTVVTLTVMFHAFANGKNSKEYLWTAFFYTLIAVLWEWVTLEVSVAAIRHL